MALSEWVQAIAYCEKDRFCQAVLLSRMSTGDIDTAPIWDDITTLKGDMLPEIDIIFGGPPCQDISVAGRGKGLGGERSGLFFEVFRLISEIRPAFIFLENVPAITIRGLDRVLREMAALGYDCRWGMLSAKEVGAMHKRERWFMLGNSKHHGTSAAEALRKELNEGENGSKATEETGELEGTGSVRDISNTTSNGKRRLPVAKKKRQSFPHLYSEYETVDEWKKAVCEMDKLSHGVSDYVVKLKSLGNSVVPEQVREAFKLLLFGHS